MIGILRNIFNTFNNISKPARMFRCGGYISSYRITIIIFLGLMVYGFRPKPAKGLVSYNLYANDTLKFKIFCRSKNEKISFLSHSNMQDDSFVRIDNYSIDSFHCFTSEKSISREFYPIVYNLIAFDSSVNLKVQSLHHKSGRFVYHEVFFTEWGDLGGVILDTKGHLVAAGMYFENKNVRIKRNRKY